MRNYTGNVLVALATTARDKHNARMCSYIYELGPRATRATPALPNLGRL